MLYHRIDCIIAYTVLQKFTVLLCTRSDGIQRKDGLSPEKGKKQQTTKQRGKNELISAKYGAQKKNQK